MDLSEPLKNQGPCPEELRNLTAENFVSPDKHARGKLSELKAHLRVVTKTNTGRNSGVAGRMHMKMYTKRSSPAAGGSSFLLSAGAAVSLAQCSSFRNRTIVPHSWCGGEQVFRIWPIDGRPHSVGAGAGRVISGQLFFLFLFLSVCWRYPGNLFRR